MILWSKWKNRVRVISRAQCENCKGEGGFLDDPLSGGWQFCPTCDGSGETPVYERQANPAEHGAEPR